MEHEAVQTRTIRVLMATNTVGYAGFIAVAAVVALLSSDLLATHQWAGLPGAVGTIGTATAAIVLAGRSKRLGRRRRVGVCDRDRG